MNAVSFDHGGGAAGGGQYAARKAALVGQERPWRGSWGARHHGERDRTGANGCGDPARAGVAPHVPPIGRWIRPTEIAAVAAFLLSDDAAAITGQQIVVCGGASV